MSLAPYDDTDQHRTRNHLVFNCLRRIFGVACCGGIGARGQSSRVGRWDLCSGALCSGGRLVRSSFTFEYSSHNNPGTPVL